MTEKAQFVDFGAPEQFGTHVFRVEIPPARTEPIRIIEDYGYRGLEEGAPLHWRPSADTVNDEQIPVICSKWAALRPEERWWLFSMTVAEAGLPEDTQRGWRRALFHALSDGEKPPAHRKRRRPADADLVNRHYRK